MAKRATLRDVAHRAKVSVGAASDILNNRTRCFSGAEARERVFTAVTELGYRPNVFARSLRERAHGALGMISHGLYSSYLVDTVETIYREAKQRGLHVLFEAEDIGGSEQAVKLLSARWTDGLFLFWPYEWIDLPSDPTLPPIVALDTNVTASEHVLIDRIGVDRGDGVFQATSYLLAQGRRRIAIEVPPDHLTLPEKMDGWRRAHVEAGLGEPDESLCIRTSNCRDYDPSGGEEMAEVVLRMSPRPDAVVTLEDCFGIGVVNRLMRHGVKVPDDIAVTGFNDSPLCAVCAIPLASVAFPVGEMARLAMEMMVERTTGEDAQVRQQPGRVVKLGMEFKPWASCGGNGRCE